MTIKINVIEEEIEVGREAEKENRVVEKTKNAQDKLCIAQNAKKKKKKK